MIRLLTALFLLFAAMNTTAAQLSQIYQAQVPVASQSDSERSNVAPEALQQTIIKVVGDRQAVNNTDISALLADANRYVARYSYQQINQVDDLTTPEQLAVEFIFDAKLLNNALQQIGLPIWGENRPQILLWLAFDSDGEQRLIGDSDNPKLSEIFEKKAEQRGLPILLPVMDLEDQIQINFKDIQTANNSIIGTASARYGARIIVSADIRANHPQVNIYWQALINGESSRWQSQGDLNTAVTMGIDQLADMLGQRFAQQIGPSQRLALQVADIDGYTDYNRLINYLDNLQAIESISVISINNNVLSIELMIQGAVSKFRERLAFDGFLETAIISANNKAEQYRLLP